MKSLFLMLALVALPLDASDVSGKWSGTFEAVTNDGNTRSEPLLLIFKQDGEKLTGSGGPNEAERHDMRDGKVVGDKITFEVALERGLHPVRPDGGRRSNQGRHEEGAGGQ